MNDHDETGPSAPSQLAPAIVLVEPQLGENIGACARAMLNCGLDDLRLVRPRDGWPNQKARATATGAVDVVDRARVFSGVTEAVADLRLVLATTGRSRDLRKPVVGPRRAARELRAAAARSEPAGILFGPERTGLENEDLVLAKQLIHVPLNPDFCSLNLAQAVLLVAWEWLEAAGQTHDLAHSGEPASSTESAAPGGRGTAGLAEPSATAGELMNFYEHLEQELDAAAFFRVPEKRGRMITGLRNLFRRAEPTSDEVKTLHGIVATLTGRRKSGEPVIRSYLAAGEAKRLGGGRPAEEGATPQRGKKDPSR